MGVGRNTLGMLLGKTSDTRVFRPDPLWVLPDTRIGVECEFEGVPPKPLAVNDPRVGYWEQHQDNSLKDQGAEFTFAEPLFGEDARKALEFLYERANTKGWRCTSRTGIHVHMDIRDLDVGQLQAILLLYAIFEKCIFNWVGDNRDESIYCLPWYKAETGMAKASELLRVANNDVAGESEAALGAAMRYERYSALNLNAMSKFGSIEFRHLKTTLDYNRVVDFINIILSLKAGALKVPTSDGALVREVEAMGPVQFGRYIFGNVLFDKLNYPEYSRDVISVGVPNANDIVRGAIESAHDRWNFETLVPGENELLAVWRRRLQEAKASKESRLKPTKKDKTTEHLEQRRRQADLERLLGRQRLAAEPPRIRDPNTRTVRGGQIDWAHIIHGPQGAAGAEAQPVVIAVEDDFQPEEWMDDIPDEDEEEDEGP